MSAKGLSYFNFCIHSEVIYDDAAYEALFNFAKDFYSLTGERIAICISTPLCPLISDALSKKTIRRDIFDAKVASLDEFARIGYHGHFYYTDGDKLVQISRANYNKDAVVRQIQKEMAWFKEMSISPRIYVAGWWFLTADIILELEHSGIAVDASVRKGKDDTFGTRYLNSEEVPEYGEPFILPPSGSIVEIQSIFGPVMPSFMMRYHLLRYLNNKIDQDRFFIFPLHDWDVPKYYRNIMSNVKALTKAKRSFGWMDVLKMRELYLDKKGN